MTRIALVIGCLLVAVLASRGPAGAAVASEACSHQVPGQPPPNAWRPAKRDLAPPNPISVRLCRYSEEPARLVRQVALTGAQSQDLVTRFAALRPKADKSGFVSCFVHIDPIIEAHLVYAGGHVVTVWAAIGCGSANNGDIALGAPPAALRRLRQTLLHLTRTDERKDRS